MSNPTTALWIGTYPKAGAEPGTGAASDFG